MGALSRHEDGTPVMTDGQLDALQHQHTLTRPEAENLFKRVAAGEDAAVAAEQIKAARVVNVPATQQVSAAQVNPLSVADKRHKEEAVVHPPKPRDSAPEVGEDVKTGTVTRKSDLPR